MYDPEQVSRVVHATGGRRICWHYRDEADNFVEHLLQVCGEVILGFLDWGSMEPRRMLVLGRTFRRAVVFAQVRLSSLSIQDANQAYVQGPDAGAIQGEDWDMEDNSDVDRVPHRTPENERLERDVVELFPALYGYLDSDSSGTPTLSPSSGSVRTLSDQSSDGLSVAPVGPLDVVDSGQVSPVPTFDGPQYAAEPGVLLVCYVDDVLRVPLAGWSLEAVHSVAQGLNDGILNAETLNHFIQSSEHVPQGGAAASISVEALPITEGDSSVAAELNAGGTAMPGLEGLVSFGSGLIVGYLITLSWSALTWYQGWVSQGLLLGSNFWVWVVPEGVAWFHADSWYFPVAVSCGISYLQVGFYCSVSDHHGSTAGPGSVTSRSLRGWVFSDCLVASDSDYQGCFVGFAGIFAQWGSSGAMRSCPY